MRKYFVLKLLKSSHPLPNFLAYMTCESELENVSTKYKFPLNNIKILLEAPFVAVHHRKFIERPLKIAPHDSTGPNERLRAKVFVQTNYCQPNVERNRDNSDNLHHRHFIKRAELLRICVFEVEDEKFSKHLHHNIARLMS